MPTSIFFSPNLNKEYAQKFFLKNENMKINVFKQLKFLFYFVN